MNRRRIAPLLLAMMLLSAGDASAQDKGSVNPKPLPPLANPDDPSVGAKELFARNLSLLLERKIDGSFLERGTFAIFFRSPTVLCAAVLDQVQLALPGFGTEPGKSACSLRHERDLWLA